MLLFINIAEVKHNKIFSKVLAYRLKKFLPRVIIEHHLAFVKGHLIFYNILAVFETLHCMKTHNSSKSGCMALKLDVSKAYDRVKRAFLENLMSRMGFSDHWINLIMVCLKIVTYSILVNGEPKGLIYPSRGIIQGDPLFPFLFLMCTESLHGSLNK